MDKYLEKLKESYKLLQEGIFYEEDPEDDIEKDYQIFVDMDGVLTAFGEQFKAVTGADSEGLGPAEYEEKYGKHQFWSNIEQAGEEFWSQMPWMPDGKQLWSYLEPHDPIILSAPSRDRKSVTGKVEWLRNNVKLSNYNLQLKCKGGWDGVSRIILNTEKHRYVRDESDILIDDTLKKIKAWREAGGTAIHHKSAQDTIRQLKELGIESN